MRDSLTQPIEDYLKVIYQLTQSGKRATTNQIARVLEVRPASVTGMVKKLAATDPPLVEYQRHRGVTLTTQGTHVALEILRHHRLLEMFLHQMLGYQWDEVHAEADRLEHVISEEFEERMAEALGNPSHDPHGDPIPNKELQMPEFSLKSLADLPPQQSAVISRVNSGNSEFLRYLSNLGLVPGAQVRALSVSPYDQNLTFLVDDQPEAIVLGPAITRQIYIR